MPISQGTIDFMSLHKGPLASRAFWKAQAHQNESTGCKYISAMAADSKTVPFLRRIFKGVRIVQTDEDARRYMTGVLESNPKNGGFFGIVVYAGFIIHKKGKFVPSVAAALLNYYSAKIKKPRRRLDAREIELEITRIHRLIAGKCTEKAAAEIILGILAASPDISMLPLLCIYSETFRDRSKPTAGGIHMAFDRYHRALSLL